MNLSIGADHAGYPDEAAVGRSGKHTVHDAGTAVKSAMFAALNKVKGIEQNEFK